LLRDVRMPVWAGHTAVASTFDKKGADMGRISFGGFGASEAAPNIAIVFAGDLRQGVLHLRVLVR